MVEILTFFEKVALKYNEFKYIPRSLTLDVQEWGPWWYYTRLLEAPPDVETISAEKAREQFRIMMSRLKVIKENWEKSRNGHDQCMILETGETNNEPDNREGITHQFPDPNQPTLGPDNVSTITCAANAGVNLKEYTTKSGSRVAFLGNNNPAIMYLWYILDKYDMLKSSLDKLSTDTLGSSLRRTRRSNEEDEAGFIRSDVNSNKGNK